MKFLNSSAFLTFSASLALAAVVHAANYSESINGPLSNDYLQPTSVAVTPGLNSISGGLTNGYDYATITIPPGYGMINFVINSLTNNGASLFAIIPGPQGAYPGIGSNDTSKLLGYVLASSQTVGANLLPSLTSKLSSPYNGTIGSKNPIPAGKYTFWIQDYADTITYKFSFFLEKAVPPNVKVKGQKVFKNRATLIVTASGIGTRLSYRIGKSGPFHKLGGQSPWKVNANGLKKGKKNIIALQAVGTFGTTNTKVTVTPKK